MTVGRLSFSGIPGKYFKYIRTLLACAAVLLAALILSAAVKYLAKDPLVPMEELGALAENESAVTIYYDFLQDMKSGQITKTSYSTKSLYDIVARTEETYVFSTFQNKQRVLTYQQRQPLVFWHYPEPGYYDGEHYYYKHGDDWFIDTFNRYYKQIQPEALGIPSDAIASYRINDSMVYHRPDGGYQAYVYAQKRGDPDTTAEVVGVLDKDFQFSYIEVTVTYPGDEVSKKDKARKAVKEAAGEEPPVIEKLIIEYDRINELIEIVPPESLTADEMEYLLEDYENTMKERENAAVQTK